MGRSPRSLIITEYYVVQAWVENVAHQCPPAGGWGTHSLCVQANEGLCGGVMGSTATVRGVTSAAAAAACLISPVVVVVHSPPWGREHMHHHFR